MPAPQIHPDQRIIDGFKAVFEDLPYSGAELHFSNGYLWFAGWVLDSNRSVIISLGDNDEIRVTSTMLGREMPAIGLTGTRFRDWDIDENGSRRIAVNTVEELVELANKLIYNRL